MEKENDLNKNQEQNDKEKNKTAKKDSTKNKTNSKKKENNSVKKESKNKEEKNNEKVEEVKIDNNENEEAIKVEETISSTTIETKENGILRKIIIIAITILILIICGKSIYNAINKDDSISGVKKLLNAKYTSVNCIDSSCNGFIVVDGDKLSKYKIMLYNVNGKKVANYKVNYNSSDKTTEMPKEIGDNYYISATMDIKKLNISKYSIKNKRGKSIYETENKLSVLNDNYVLMEDTKAKTGEYTILTKKGKTKYSNISYVDTYLNGKYIVTKIDDTYSILNEKGEKILTNYEIRKVVTDEKDNELYMIVRNTVDNIYNYYSISKEKIIGDSFTSYTSSDETGELVITKKENDNNIKYTLSKDGKQIKLEDSKEAIQKIKEQIDSDKYKLYEDSVYSSDQNNVLVDNKNEKSFGVFNLKNNKFKSLYNYKSDKNYFYSTVSKLNSINKEDNILKISCSDYSCDKKESIIYDVKNNKELYKVDNINVSDYKEYEDGYKVVSFSSDRTNNYGSKNVVFDKSNKEIEVSNNNITIVDKKLVYGEEDNYSITLYSIKKGKILNTQKATKEEVSGNVVYKYTDKNDNIIIINSKGNEVIKVSDNDYFKSSDGNYIYIKENMLYVYNIKKNKTYKYKMRDNEKLNDASGYIISPYRNTIFVNNSSDKYVKVLNFKGNQIKKIKNVEISEVEFNKDEKKAFIIVKKNTKEGSLYGLYVAE